MTSALARILVAAVSVTMSAAVIPQTRRRPDGEGESPRKMRRPSITVEDQQGSPLSLRLSAVEPVPDKPGMVKITLGVWARAGAAVRRYHVHYEEAFGNKDGAGGSVVKEYSSGRRPPHEIDFIAYKDAKVEVWVSAVELADGSGWKSRLAPELSGSK